MTPSSYQVFLLSLSHNAKIGIGLDLTRAALGLRHTILSRHIVRSCQAIQPFDASLSSSIDLPFRKLKPPMTWYLEKFMTITYFKTSRFDCLIIHVLNHTGRT